MSSTVFITGKINGITVCSGTADRIFCMSADGLDTEWRTPAVVASGLWANTPGYGDANQILCMSAAGSATEWKSSLSIVSITDDVSIIDGTDTSKVMQFQCSSITTSSTRTLTVPDVSGTMLVGYGAADQVLCMSAAGSAIETFFIIRLQTEERLRWIFQLEM